MAVCKLWAMRLSERQLRLRRQLAEKHPNLTHDQTQRHERRIAELVAEFRQKQRRPQQEQPQPARSQEQGRGLEPSR